TISGNTAPGGGTTAMITVTGGSQTSVNSLSAITFTLASLGTLTAIDVTLLNNNDALTIGTPTGIVNLPGASLSVTAGKGNQTFTMGSAGSASAAAVNNVLSAVTWQVANVNSTASESVSILNAVVGSITVQENSGPNDLIQLWGVTANGSSTLTQNNGA